MADKSFIEKQGHAEDVRDVGVAYKIRKIGFPIAVVLCLLLLIVCIVLAILYSKELSKPPVTPPKDKKYKICEEERCFRLGMDMVKKMDQSVDPCNDFYAYACRGWQIRNPAKNGSSREVSVAPLLGEDDLSPLKKALETSKSNYSQNCPTRIFNSYLVVGQFFDKWKALRFNIFKNFDLFDVIQSQPRPFAYFYLYRMITPKNTAVLKTIRYYESCTNTTAANALGFQPLKDLVQQYGGWSVSSNIDPNVPLTTRIGKTLRDLGVNTLLDISVISDPLNSTKRILKLDEPSTGMSMYWYKNKNSSSKEHLAYKRLLKIVGRMATGSNSSDAKMMAIYHFEKSLAKIFRNDDDDATTNHRVKTFAGKESRRRRFSDSEEKSQMSLLAFCKATGMPWSSFLEKTLRIIFARNFTGNEDIKLYYSNTKSFQKLYTLIQNTNKSVVVDYIMWMVIRKYSKALPEVYNSTKQEFPPAAVNSTRHTKPRWRECIDQMQHPFDMTLNFLYTALFLKQDPKKKLENMFENIRLAFIDGLKRGTWMDSSTKENAKQKALAMTGDIAYPSYIKNPSEIQKRYESLHITDDYFSNYKAIAHFEKMENLNTYDSPVNKSEWTFDSVYVMNAFYYAENNKIVVPAGIMQPPFYYSPGLPMYLAYGGIGMVIGHEITHGFDGNGRKFDKNGQEEDWWSKASSERFNQKAKCLEKQYDEYSFYGIKVNGTMTLDENIADNGGVRLAYEAYQRWTKVNGVETILPGLTLSPDQLFFMAFAQMWCSSFNKASSAAYAEKDPYHTFPEYRVFGPLTNFDKFSEAFNCPANSPMNPSSKCVIW